MGGVSRATTLNSKETHPINLLAIARAIARARAIAIAIAIAISIAIAIARAIAIGAIYFAHTFTALMLASAFGVTSKISMASKRST